MAFQKRRTEVGGLGVGLREMRRRLDMNTVEFSKRVGWPRNTISQYELGLAKPGTARLLTLLRLAQGAVEREPIVAELCAQGVERQIIRLIVTANTSTDSVKPSVEGCNA